MEVLKKLEEFSAHRDAFVLLERTMFRDIALNGLNVRILGIYYMDCKADWTIKSHKHSFYEFHYVVQQSAYTCLNGTEFEIDAGSFYLMPPGTMHAHTQKNNAGHVGFALRWELLKADSGGNAGAEVKDFREISDMLNFLSRIPLKIIRDDGRIIGGMLGLLEAAEGGQPDLCLKLALLKIIADTAAFYSSPGEAKNAEFSRTCMDDHIVEAAVRFIEENYNQDIDVKDVAKSSYISYSHLARIFKAATGESVKAYINKVRILKAQYLLKCSRLSIASVASKTGFQSETYFCDVFRKAMGTSPLSYRKYHSRFSE